jgi:hypothetical protein
LSLAESIVQTHGPDGRRQVQVPATVAIGWHHLGRRGSRDYFGLILV